MGQSSGIEVSSKSARCEWSHYFPGKSLSLRSDQDAVQSPVIKENVIHRPDQTDALGVAGLGFQSRNANKMDVCDCH